MDQASAAVPPEKLLSELYNMFPNCSRAEIRDAARKNPDNMDACVEQLLSQGGYTKVQKKSKKSGEEKPIIVRALRESDIKNGFEDRFKLATPDDVQKIHLCYPKMEIVCKKCSNSWSSVGFPGVFGFHKNYERFSVYGDLTTFRQKCKTCNEPLWPTVDEQVMKRFLHAVELRIEASGGRAARKLDERETHRQDLCEGCEVDVCRFSSNEPTREKPAKNRR